MSLQRGINLRALAEKMGQCSGAEVRGICTEAGMYALRERRQHIRKRISSLLLPKCIVLHFSLRKLFCADRIGRSSQQVMAVIAVAYMSSLRAHVCSTGAICSLLEPWWWVYPILSSCIY